jgi:hypothetical protein
MNTHKLLNTMITVSLLAFSLMAVGTMAARANGNFGVISVTPNTGLTDGQAVQISGSEFQKNGALRIVECGPSQQPPIKGGGVSATCTNYSVDVTTDNNGTFPPQSFTVSTFIQGFTREHGHNVPATHDCLPANDCHIHVYAPVNGDASANQDISFSQ